MIKKFIGILFFLYFHSSAQSPFIKWEKTYGGSDNDEGNDVVINSINQIVLAGYTFSRDGDLSVSNNDDAWFLRLDSTGQIIKNVCIGGSLITQSKSLIKSDNGFVQCGLTHSFDLNRFHGSMFNIHYDAVVFKTDSDGTLQWLNCYGSYGDDKGVEIKQCIDSGYIFVSDVELDGFDVHGAHGSTDWWVTKIDSIGQIQWSRCMGGSSTDFVKGVTTLPFGGYLVLGINGSSDGDVACINTNERARIVKLDEQGNILWDKCFGNGTVIAGDLLVTSDGGFIGGASANSNNGDVNCVFGQDNFWVFKCDSLGQIQWTSCYGGLLGDMLKSISKTSDGGYLLAGESRSNPQSTTIFNNDALIIKIDSVGNQEWIKYLGGTNEDGAKAAVELPDHDVVMVGYTQSANGDVSFNHGMKDVWVVRLGGTVGVSEIEQTFSFFEGRINNDFATLYFSSSISTPITISFFDLSGRELKSVNQNSILGKNQFEIPVSLSQGAYIIKVTSSRGMLSKLVMAE